MTTQTGVLVVAGSSLSSVVVASAIDNPNAKLALLLAGAGVNIYTLYKLGGGWGLLAGAGVGIIGGLLVGGFLPPIIAAPLTGAGAALVASKVRG